MTTTESKTEDTEKTQLFVVLSGVTSGLGRALCQTFHANGHIVAGFGRRGDKIKELKTELRMDESDLLIKTIDICNEDELVDWAGQRKY